jgi:hypothetical protein
VVTTPTYKHLEGKTVLGAFSLDQWAQLLAGVALGLVFGIYLSPLPAQPTIFLALLLPGLPLLASCVLLGPDFSLGALARANWRYLRRPRRYLPGPGRSAVGYIVEPDPNRHQPHPAAHDRPDRAELEALWDV